MIEQMRMTNLAGTSENFQTLQVRRSDLVLVSLRIHVPKQYILRP